MWFVPGGKLALKPYQHWLLFRIPALFQNIFHLKNEIGHIIRASYGGNHSLDPVAIEVIGSFVFDFKKSKIMSVFRIIEK